jgi:hypothetical protein
MLQIENFYFIVLNCSITIGLLMAIGELVDSKHAEGETGPYFINKFKTINDAQINKHI